MNRAFVLLCTLVCSAFATACEGDAGRSARDEPDVGGPALDEETRAEITARLDQAEHGLEAIGREIGDAADTVAGRFAAGLDSLRVRAAELRGDLGHLEREAGASGERAVDEVRARLDSLDREMWSLRFEAAEDVAEFRRTAGLALDSLDASLGEVERQIERRGDRVDADLRERWGQLRGEFVELRTEAETIAEATSRETRETFAEARRTFGRQVALLAREVRLLSADLRTRAPAA